ncbi:MAG: O-antigen ligase family protein, partial [Candidatus Falkowbacteria bacterium]
FLVPSFMTIVFGVVIALFLVITLHKLEYGIYIALAELFIGSKGYLFFLEIDDFTLSIRIAFWLVLMSVWAGKNITRIFSEKKLSFLHRRFSLKRGHILPYFLFLFLFMLWGIVNGFLHNNDFGNIFFDFNGWLYFTLIFPLYDIFVNKRRIFRSESEAQEEVSAVFAAAVVWLGFKTFFLLFIFSHDMIGMTAELYRWVRLTGVGELTRMQGGFYRIFLQSQIFSLAGFFIILCLWTERVYKNGWKNINSYLSALFAVLLLATIVISFSRSFWVGLAVGLLLFAVFSLWRYGLKRSIGFAGFITAVAVASLCLILITVKFPYPKPLGGYNAVGLLTERAGSLTGEAAVSSRWNLLPELWKKISREAVFGQGFGATVTYESNDPRVRETNATGEYTTYAFEWGWLDIWLKLGIFGLLTYLFILFNITLIAVKLSKTKKAGLYAGLAIGLIVVAAVNFFSPYYNHPLGIGYLMLTAVIFESRLAGFRCGQLSLDKN